MTAKIGTLKYYETEIPLLTEKVREAYESFLQLSGALQMLEIQRSQLTEDTENVGDVSAERD